MMATKRKLKWKWQRWVGHTNATTWYARRGPLILQAQKGSFGWLAEASFEPPEPLGFTSQPSASRMMSLVYYKSWRFAKGRAECIGVELLERVYVAAKDMLELDLGLELPTSTHNIRD